LDIEGNLARGFQDLDHDEVIITLLKMFTSVNGAVERDKSKLTRHYCIEVISQRPRKALLQGKYFFKCKEIYIIRAVDGLCNSIDLMSN